jgi:hypothetical protein
MIELFWMMIKFMFGLALSFAGVVAVLGIIICGITGFNKALFGK